MAETADVKRVLLIDDEPNVLMATVRSLHGQPFKFYTARNAEEGMKIVQDHAVDIVVVDERMPGMRGTQFLGWIADVMPKTVRIMMTGERDDATFLRAALEARIDRFLTKPASRDVLLAALTETVRKRSWKTALGPEPTAQHCSLLVPTA
jgi:response regulator RpfG family c-di-GMP phosphodiesterase